MNTQILAGPVARIMLRYLAGTLVGQSVVDVVLADPDLMTLATALVGAVLGVVIEWLYRRAKRTGGAT